MRQTPGRRRGGRRLGWLDVVVTLLLLAGVGWLAYRVDTVLVYAWDWSVVPGLFVRLDERTGSWVLTLLGQGATVTLRLSLWSSLLAALIGLLVALARISRGLFLRLLGRAYVELVRNVPPLVFIFVFYFFISSQIMPALGIGDWARDLPRDDRALLEWLVGDRKQIESFMSGVLCLAMLEAAYVAEIIRGGLASLPRGQWEAAAALGLRRYHQLKDVILPQAIRRTVPPLAGQLISLVKDSSIVSLISIQELTFLASQSVVSTRRTFEVWITVALVYLVFCFALSFWARHLERRFGTAVD